MRHAQLLQLTHGVQSLFIDATKQRVQSRSNKPDRVSTKPQLKRPHAMPCWHATHSSYPVGPIAHNPRDAGPCCHQTTTAAAQPAPWASTKTIQGAGAVNWCSAGDALPVRLVCGLVCACSSPYPTNNATTGTADGCGSF